MVKEKIDNIIKELPSGVKLVAVSKYHPVESIIEAYEAGQRLFGENRPQELVRKVEELKDKSLPGLEWTFQGHLQTNKLKMVLPYVSLVQSVDSVHLLQEIDKWGKANGRVVDVLLEMHIGAEESKQGFYEEEILDILFNAEKYRNIRFKGLMGMASHTDDEEMIRADFTRIASYKEYLDDLFPELEEFTELSIGMSDDYKIAVECGSTMVRIGTAIFGPRQY